MNEMNEVVILQWPSLASHHTVSVGEQQVGCISNGVDTRAYFHSYRPFDNLNAYDRTRVLKATREKVTLLNVTRRLTK